MASSTTRARWSLTGAATTLARRGWMTPAGSWRRIWSSCWVGAELGQVRPRPVSGQMGGRHGDRARAHLDAGQERGALLTATGRGEPQLLHGRQGQP